MVVYEREETYINYTTLRDREGEPTDADVIEITITSPCGTLLTDSASMTHITDGIYDFGQDIPTDAIFGQYDVRVVATQNSIVSVFTETFFRRGMTTNKP